MKTNITKSPNHKFFWIEDGVLFETCLHRWPRWKEVLDVPGMPDRDYISKERISFIEARYLDSELDQRFDLLADYLEYYTDFLVRKATYFGTVSGQVNIRDFGFTPSQLINIYDQTGYMLFTHINHDVYYDLDLNNPLSLEEWEQQRIESVVTY